MLIRFSESFALPATEVYAFFETPAAWTRIFGFAGEVEDRGGGWYAVPLRRFPFPLVAKVTVAEPGRHVRWIFRGFWRGTGEVRFNEEPGGVRIEGYEEIGVRWLGPFSRLVERAFLERPFQRLWASGWRRLRRLGEPGVERRGVGSGSAAPNP